MCIYYLKYLPFRYDILQQLLEVSLEKKVPLKATKEKTLLQFFTELNQTGKFDNVIYRVLEYEKKKHNMDKVSSIFQTYDIFKRFS